MNLGPWKFFKQQPAGEEDGDEGGAGQGDSTAYSDDFNSSADDEAAAEGERLLEEEGDKVPILDDEEEEQPEEDDGQDPDEDEEEEEQPEKAAIAAFKDVKTGNWDWKKITKAIGSPELEKTFKETQAQITKVSQENKGLREQVQQLPQVKQRAELMDHLDRAFHLNPEFRNAAMKALGMVPGNEEPEFQLPEGVNPQDPLVPLIMRQQQMLDTFLNRQRQDEHTRQANETKATFLQGLKDAQSSFASLVGRQPTEDEMRSVAERMRTTRHYAGQDWVPSLFVKEIQESAKRTLRASHKEKRNLPSKGRSGVGPSKTQKSSDLRDSFDAAWDESFG